MRAVPDSTTLQASAGSSAQLAVDVTNTAQVIDGITARVVGLDPDQVTSTPPLLPLFPDASGTLSLRIDVPVSFPAGRHPLTVELLSSVESIAPHHVDIDLVVAPRPQLTLLVKPAVRRARRRSRHLVECRNGGNVPLAVVLTADDPERALRSAFSVPSLTIEPGATASAMLTVRAKRRVFGSDLDRPVAVAATAVEHDVADSGTAVLRHRPLIPRGVLTVAVLACIIALWAGAFLLGLTKVFSGDPLTKTAPASFFVTMSGDTVLQASGSSLVALSKTGTLPAGVGGGISGTVTAASTGTGTGRIVVEALRRGRSGLVTVSSAATQADGTYLLQGLLPGDYLVRFSAPGFRTAWYPSATSQALARPVSAAPQTVTQRIDTNVVGLPASISGSVDPGDALVTTRTVVTIRSLAANAPTTNLATATTDEHGHYALRGLPAPGSYELGFATPGYAPTTVIEKVGAGQARSEPTVRLSAGDGAITGLVVDGAPGATPLGEVTVSTSQDGKALTTATPTQGQVGRFTLSGLATPGTYVLTLVKPGFGAVTRTVALNPGQRLELPVVRLLSGTGAVSGRVLDVSGRALGGVIVSIGGTPAPVQTTTLTDGSAMGSYSVSGLPAPGSYTLTFSLPGFAPQTLPLKLGLDGPAPAANAVLVRGVGRLLGRISDSADGWVPGATVSVTDGAVVRTTVSVDGDASHAPGSYSVPDLPPGTYTVTVTREGARPQTALVTVRAAADSCQNLRSVLLSATVPGTDPPPCG